MELNLGDRSYNDVRNTDTQELGYLSGIAPGCGLDDRGFESRY
jgi:hypothetical protein